jgi:hypothetical protein
MDESIKKALSAIEHGSRKSALGALAGLPSRPRPQKEVPRAMPPVWDKQMTIIAAVILSILTAVIYGLVVLLDKALTPATLQTLRVKIAVSVTILVGAIVLYLVKVSVGQFLYGLAEIAAGLVANWRSLEGLASQLADPKGTDPLFARLAVLAGGLYLIGRGIANFAEGMKRLDARMKLPKAPPQAAEPPLN